MLPQDFCTYLFDDSVYIQNLWICESISLKIFMVFFKNFLDFSLDTTEKHPIYEPLRSGRIWHKVNF